MINTYSPWAELAGTKLDLVWSPMEGRLGEYAHDLGVIRLDPRMPRRQARSVLCHELRHAQCGDVRTSCDRVNLRQEQWADNNAARLMIDIRDLAESMVLNDERLSACAVDLRVSDHLLRVRLKHLHASERHFLTRRLNDGMG